MSQRDCAPVQPNCRILTIAATPAARATVDLTNDRVRETPAKRGIPVVLTPPKGAAVIKAAHIALE
jgi:hypothetical protein